MQRQGRIRLLLNILPPLAALGAHAADGLAQSYPARPLRMIVAIGAGGGTDVTARIVSQKLSEQIGVPVVVENRPGAGTIIGTRWWRKPRRMATR